MKLTSARDVTSIRAGLERWLGHPVGEIARPDPGWSCETLVVDRKLVIRLPPAGEGIFPDYDLALQAVVQEAVGSAGVPVASPVSYEPDPSFLGAPFIAMPFVEGPIPSEFTPADRWLTSLPDDASRRNVRDAFLDTVTRIHETPTAGLDLREGLDVELDYWETYLSWATDGEPPQPLAGALDWCRSSRPVADPDQGLLWGDVRLGNVVFDPAMLVPKAVLDWDMACIGPFEMDVAWFLALEDVQSDLTDMRVAGFGSHDDTVAWVESRIRRPLVDLEWYEVFALVRASAVSTRIAVLFERAGRPSMFEVGRDPSLAAALARIEKAP